MSLEYVGLKVIKGLIIFLEGLKDIGYEEVVEICIGNNEVCYGCVIEILGDIVVVEVFEGIDGMMLKDVYIKFLGYLLRMGLFKEVLGCIFNGVGLLIDGLGLIFFNVSMDVNGEFMNLVFRRYFKNFI